MRMGQGVRTGLGHGASPVSYRHNFLVQFVISEFHKKLLCNIQLRFLNTDFVVKKIVV